MSAPLAGSFQDHYAVLGIDHKANLDTIQTVYSALVKKFKPGTPGTGDKKKFDAVNQAYEVLCDPFLRKEFDKLKGLEAEEKNPQFSGRSFFESLGRHGSLRAAVLSILYDRRQKRPFKPGLSMRNLEGCLNVANEELEFALWYVKRRGLVANDDKSNLEITVEGMDFLEQLRPTAEAVMPFLKPVPSSEPEPAAEPEVAASAEHHQPPGQSASQKGSAVLALDQALSRR